jgi:ADP-ribose pyrophosphatase
MITKIDVKFSGYYQLEELTIKQKENNIIKREFLRNKDGVAAIVYNTEIDKYIFVSQWRICSEKNMTEVVAGSIEEGESPIQAIEKEVLEEVGYKVDRVKKINSFYVSPGTIKEKVHLFFVTVSEKVNNGGGKIEENEELDVIYYNYDEVIIKKFLDAKTIIAQNWLKFEYNLDLLKEK